jgi:hypothetical protein
MLRVLAKKCSTSRGRLAAWSWVPLIGIALVLLTAGTAMALEVTGTIIGTVTDSNGGVIVGADVTVTNSDTNVQNKTVTGAGGFFNVPDLPPGKYDVSVEYKGFKTGVSTANDVVVGQNTRVDFALSPGDISEKVQVTAQAPLVASTTSNLSTDLEVKQINNLPLNGRLFQSLVGEAPGTTPGAWADQDENPAASGGSFSGGNGSLSGSYFTVNGFFFGGDLWLVDGVHNNEPQNDYLTMAIPLLDIDEFNINTSNPDAQYGTFGGAVISVETKSGTNAWHGGLFDYIRNDAFNAIDAFSTSKAPYHANQFGGAIGGPIKKDKLWFYVDYQQLLQNAGTTDNITVPTAAMRTGNLSALDSHGAGPITNAAACQTIAHAQGIAGAAPCTASSADTVAGTFDTVPTVDISPISTAVLGTGVTPATNVTSACALAASCNNADFNPVNVENVPQFDAKVDFAPSDSNRFFARVSYMHRNFTQPSPGTIFEQGGPYATNSNDLDAVGWDHTFSPTMTNEFRVGFNRYDTEDFQNAFATSSGQTENNTLGIKNGNIASIPETFGIASFNVSGFNMPGGAGAVPDGLGRLANIFEYNDTLTKIAGRNSFKFGTDIERLQTSVRNPQNNPPGIFSFGSGSGSYTGNSLADFLVGAPNEVQRDVGPLQPATRVLYAGFFVQDDFRVTQKLTLNLGIRYDIYTAPHDAHNLQSNFVIAGPNAGYIQLASNSNPGPNVSTYLKNFEPRVGFAYSPDNGKTAVRGAFGISDFPANFGGNGGTNERNFPETLQENNFAPSTSNPASALLLSCGLPGLTISSCTTPGGSVVTYQPLTTPASTTCPGGSGECILPPSGFGVFDVANDFRQDEVMAYNLSVQRQITHDMAATVAYVGNHGYHLYNDYQLNTCNPPSVGGVPATTPGCLPFNDIGFDNTVDFRNSGGLSTYNALQAQLVKRTAIGLTLQASYTWSKWMSNISNPEDPYDTTMRMVGVGWESSNFPQQFTFSYVYDLPFGRNRKFASGASTAEDEIIGGWQVTGVTTFRAGGGLMIGASGSMPSVGSYSNYANFTCFGGKGATNQHTITEWFDTGCFSTPANFTYGDGTTSNVYGSGLQNWDFSVNKAFNLGGEGRQLKFDFNFYNVFNHVNLNNPNTGCNAPAGESCSLSNNGFGVINSDAGPRTAAIDLNFAF